MKHLKSVAFIGNYLPRRCGIATFTHDLHSAVAAARPDLATAVVAMNDADSAYAYPAAVRFEIREAGSTDYRAAASHLNDSSADVVSLQHEYGIFGGDAGGKIVELLSDLKKPVVTTLHTVLAQPSPAQHDVMQRIIEKSASVVVMSEKGRQLLHSCHDIADDKIDVIPHGIPDYPFVEPSHAKAKLGFTGRTVILTFGLLSPSKGIETVIDAMPQILKSCPNAVYVVLGATHPNLVRHEGETYRMRLATRVRDLQIEKHVVFLNQFVDHATLLDHISMCDVYVTPYLNEAQMTSGTLAYSFGLGKAVVSTPYWHAKELLQSGLGILVPFGDSKAIGNEISALLGNDVRRHAMRKRAYAASRPMTWTQTGHRYISSFSKALNVEKRHLPTSSLGATGDKRALPVFQTSYLRSMCDSTGILQHAIHDVPDRSHGYCVDDNARALLLACAVGSVAETRLPDSMTTSFAAFVQSAWNSDTQRFRNFMSYDRRWLEAQGSEDSHGRTLWALASCAATDVRSARRNWAQSLFKLALPSVQSFTSPRAWAFTLLALDIYCPQNPRDNEALSLQTILADKLMMLFSVSRRADWIWFEDVLSYDNARLSQALIQTGITTGREAYLKVGIDSLLWLIVLQTAPSGCFRPVGSDSFGNQYAKPEPFDQQPLEATATIAACLAASRHEKHAQWSAHATRAFDWFLGHNDLRTLLVDLRTGGCLDGLHADRANRNMGAESVLSYLLSVVDMRQLLSAGIFPDRSLPAAGLALRA
jgi:glycosyltransferase involved in cell wall biosynthesis